jgi:hypothetical protein
VLECWSVGVVEWWVYHYSTTPLLHHSVLGSSQRLRQQLGHVARPDRRQVLDLMAATCAGGDNGGAEGLGPDLLG